MDVVSVVILLAIVAGVLWFFVAVVPHIFCGFTNPCDSCRRHRGRF